MLVSPFVGARANADGGTLRIAFTSIRQLDPYKTGGNGDEGNIGGLVFDSLVYLDAKATPQPLLATSWTTPNSTTWIFNLRRGVKFQDDNPVFAKGKGREVTAEDVVYSINRFVKVTNAFSIGDIASAKATGKYTVELKTAKPNPFLVIDPNQLAQVAIVPREAIEKLGEEGFARAPIGSGPFKVQAFTPNQTITLNRNENYWLKPKLKQVQFIYLPDPTVATLAVQSNRVDVVSYLLNVDSATQLATQKSVKLITGPGSYRGLGFNVKTAPFNDVNVRKALAMAMDIDSAYKSVLGVHAVRAYGQVPPWVPFGYDASLKNLWSYDPAGAAALLTKAGYAKNAAGLYAKGGKTLSVPIKTIAGSQVRVLTILVTQLKAFGIDASIQQQDVSVWADDLVKGNNTGLFFDFSFAGTTGLSSLFNGDNIGTTNTHQYKNASVDALFAQALTTVNAQQRSSLWKRAQRAIFQDKVGIPLYFENGYSVVNTKVQDFVPAYGPLKLVTPTNNVMFNP
ncbi:ABC transporter substrate-binding protein [Deinococcus humi]|uniref:Peptide/nickel transport system substrate-binding protein n=1 Tax=Deinococcus humi TaxID=662880 RepID=A0A7W8NI24_9DEIO|nr:ABC transporter substrate-binding protein [Deinococcus humi]MBB5365383.1 peptide/nickel transport system substrate-binding protein [Deinococcus humi]GGO36118.1 ABC transporter substrate-binding protein [Deinococcus humi]